MAGYIMAVAVGMVLEYYALRKWFPVVREAVLAWWRKKVSAVVLQGLKTLPEDARNEVFRQSVNPFAGETPTERRLTVEWEPANPFAD